MTSNSAIKLTVSSNGYRFAKLCMAAIFAPMPRTDASLIPPERIEQSILLVRGQKVLLDRDLAVLYGVTTANLNKAVKRNPSRFPDDFMFQLTRDEADRLIFQSGISKPQRGGTRHLPYAFTEQGVAMLSGVLHSDRAIEVNVAIMRIFVRLRELISSHGELARRLDDLEKKYDKQFAVVFDAIRQLMSPVAAPKKRQIGFHANPDDETIGRAKARRK